MKILIAVADNALVSTYEHTLARARYHEMVICSTKAEALQHFRQATFDAAIVHGDFPDSKGMELVASIRNRAPADFTVIGLPATAAEKLRGDWIQAGATVVIGPELDLLDLLKALGVTFNQPLQDRSGTQ